MSAPTLNGSPVVKAMEIVNKRLAKKYREEVGPLTGREIAEFAEMIEAQMQGSAPLKESASSFHSDAENARLVAELEQLRERHESMRAKYAETQADRDKRAVALDHRVKELDDARADLQKASTEIERVDALNVELADKIEAQQRKLEQLGQQHGAELQKHINDVAELESRVELQRQELNAVIVERDELATRLASHKKHVSVQPKEAPHRHAYEWVSPDELPRDCAVLVDGRPCGHPYPRDLRETEEVVPDTTSWDELIEAARFELEELGWPDETEKLGLPTSFPDLVVTATDVDRADPDTGHVIDTGVPVQLVKRWANDHHPWADEAGGRYSRKQVHEGGGDRG